MNISNETEQMLIMKLLGLSGDTEAAAPTSPFIGQRVMVRTYSAGVHFGTLKSKNGQNAVLENAHRVYYWAKACSLSQLAMEGDKDIENSKISMAVSSIELDQVIEVIPLGSGVFEQLTSKLWKK
jgi:hypothetical protein